jgi:hypothetical protein
MPRLVDSPSALRVSVKVERFAEFNFGGSIALGPTPVTRSQFVNPASVEPALTWGSCMSAPEDGAFVSGVQPVLDGVGTATDGIACGVNVDL